MLGTEVKNRQNVGRPAGEGEHFTWKGTATPYANGTRFRRKSDGLQGVILCQCPCTSPWIHYEVRMDDGVMTAPGHEDFKTYLEII
jgi:hypothetical protein